MLKSALIVTVISLLPYQAFSSFEISPIIVTAAPSGPNATVTMVASNSGNQKTPIQVTIYQREPDLEGVEKYTDANAQGDFFQVIPSQFILNPKEKRSIRITYVGDPQIKKELAFRVIAEEFPIDVTDSDKVKNKAVAAISILSKYVGSLYVKPLITIPDVVIESSVKKEGNNNKLVLLFENKGSEHKILKNVKYKVVSTTDKKEYEFPFESVQAIGAQNILAGKKRQFVIPWPSGIPVGPLKVSLESTKK